MPPGYGAVAEAAGRARIWTGRVEGIGDVDWGKGAVVDVVLGKGEVDGDR